MPQWWDRMLGRDQAAETVTTTQPAVPETRAQASGSKPPERSEFATITPESALRLGSVFRAVQILVTAVSQMRFTAYQDGRELQVVPPLVRSPNVNTSRSAFVEETMFSLAAYGNAFWYLTRQSRQDPPSSVQVLDVRQVTVEPVLNSNGIDTGRRRYMVGDREVRSDRIQQLQLFRRPGRVLGLGPLQASAEDLRALQVLKQYTNHWFETSGVPTGGTLETEQALGYGEAEQYAQAWRNFIKEHKVGVLSSGLTYNPPSVEPEKAQFVEVQNGAILSVARIFGIPPLLLLTSVSGASMTYQNLESINLQFLQTTLTRYMNEIEQNLSALLPAGQQVEFNAMDLIRLDADTKWQMRRRQVEVGYTTGAQLRAEDGLPPLPEDAQLGLPKWGGGSVGEREDDDRAVGDPQDQEGGNA